MSDIQLILGPQFSWNVRCYTPTITLSHDNVEYQYSTVQYSTVQYSTVQIKYIKHSLIDSMIETKESKMIQHRLQFIIFHFCSIYLCCSLSLVKII